MIMDEAPTRDREYYELALNALAGIEDDLIASNAPIEAIDKVREALALCISDFRRKFSL